MEKIVRVVVGPIEENCYLVQPEAGGVLYIIDPGDEAGRIAAAVGKFTFSEVVILFTHGHFDHIHATGELVKLFGVKKAYLHAADHELFFSPLNAYLPFIPPAKNLPAVSAELEFEGIKILHTPGHTPGGVSFYVPSLGALFSGDTLFRGSVGRSDLPGGDHAQQIKSIREKLLTLPGATAVYPGHGDATTIDREKLSNPFL